MDKGQCQRKRAEEESIEGASTSSFISPVPTDVGSGQYDVFLSFRGSDTRKAFTDCLYHSLVEAGTVPICVFKDDNSIPVGEEFGSKILDAITWSKISIPVISENYASSKWCLHELIHIMDRKKSTSHIVLPIFYKVAPSDVRHLTGHFGDAFCLSQESLDEEDIQEGQQALKEVSYLNGWESEKIANGHEGELIARVVETVLSELRGDFQLDVPKQLVGLDGHLKKIMNWIDSPSINARMIGIYGMGGIGKTTLAKRIYNELLNKFVHVSFLPDVRETTRRHGITYLQSQLISDIQQSKSQVSRIDDGINIIKSRFRGKKVLILLDDIDDKNQLDALAREHNWFMAGSMIIVTTRNEAVLDQSEFEVDYKYELYGLDEVHALLLFNRHAFCMDHSPRDFEGISRDIISTMGGLPLALRVVGSYLYKKTNREVWEDVRKQLKNQPHKDVQEILRISYDALEDGHKQIFLDIVCFFIGKRSEVRKFAMYMWEDCGFYPSQGIEELKLRCLIKIGDDGEFMVHDQLRDLGRSIFCQGQPLDKRCGPWDCNYRGASRVVRDYKRSWFRDWMRTATSGDSSNELLSEIRWLQWEVWRSKSPLPTTNLHLPNLSVLELSESVMTEDREEGSLMTPPERLQVHRWCFGLRYTRDFSDLSHSQIITEDWEGWSLITPAKQLQVHRWIFGLRCTPDFSDLSYSHIITEDWEGWSLITTAERLRVLDLSGCNGLRCTPDLSAFTQLRVLRLDHCAALEHLHPSVGKLKSLISLELSFCFSLKELPEEVCELKELEELVLDDSGITEISTSIIGSLKKLKTLSAYRCESLREIPNSIGDLQNLQHLNLSDSGIEKLPSAIGDLSSLQHLDLWRCDKLRSLPRLSSLIHLEELHLLGCHLLEDIPELPSRLLILRIEKCGKLILLKLDGLKNLEELSIKRCSSIERLDLSRLIHLKRLHAEHCNDLVEIQGSDNLEFLEGIFIYDCNSFKRLLCPKSGRLKWLVAVRCNNLVEIRGLDGAKFLEVLDFIGCESMEMLPNLTGCEKLRSLIVRNYNKLTQLRELEKLDLIDLDISGCDSLEAISKLSCTRVIRSSE
ncbi:disease resistance protein RPV1-like [Syzygium oleosum]|uniref:disease resistance protein RPV1-like n=1 Tax=Syzygium oleosum TaxID=219896 RepID=UPI0024B9157B|nr:disease resistance protein RPV1-like [Syzygium oleosum]XP_056165502.1 disease resistance protein RPV1-like [Syzygium oleosum]